MERSRWFWRIVQLPFALGAWLYNGLTKKDWKWR
jgi:hypothetical protein